MRSYEIIITDQNDKPKVVAGLFNGTFTSQTKSKTTIPGALNVELDLPIYSWDAPLDGAAVRVWGVGLPLLSQATDFNPSFDNKKYCNIQISGGMAKGLPLANPKQFGVLLKGQIQQAFGNWQGTAQTLDFVVTFPSGTSRQPRNIIFNCKNGEPFAAAIKNTLNTAFKDLPKPPAISVNIDPKLIAYQDEPAYYENLAQFASYLNEKSKSIIRNPNYYGIKIANNIDGSIRVYDGAVPVDKPTQIEFQDLIGQPTWIAPYTLGFKVVMRSGIQVGDRVLMPKVVPAQFKQFGLALTTPQTQSQYKTTSNFQGEFTVAMVRHLGNFRQRDPNSWVTVIEAFSTGSV